MDREIDLFIQDYLKEIREDNASIFAGAGLSAPAGFVNWRDLLHPIAEELRLDVEKEHDLVAVAQYHCNENGGNRHKLNQLLIQQLTVGAVPTDTRPGNPVQISTTQPINYALKYEGFSLGKWQ